MIISRNQKGVLYTRTNAMRDEQIKVKSLGKAMRILECFIGRGELGVTEISSMLGLGKSNVHDILSTFIALGYVEQNKNTEKYRLGYRILELSHSLTSNIGFRKTVYPHMKQLADEFGEIVYLGVPENFDVIYLDAAYPGHEFMTRAMLGDRAHMYCTGIGKAMLSCMGRTLWEQLIKLPLEAYTPMTITDPQKLIAELEEIRQKGYAVDNMEHEHGVRCVGVPILNSRNELAAGISISAPSPRMDEEKTLYYAHRLREIAKLVGIYF